MEGTFEDESLRTILSDQLSRGCLELLPNKVDLIAACNLLVGHDGALPPVKTIKIYWFVHSQYEP